MLMPEVLMVKKIWAKGVRKGPETKSKFCNYIIKHNTD